MTRPGNPVDSDGQATMQTSQAPHSIVWVRRWRFETLRILVSLVVLGIATAIAVGPLPGWEVNLFRVMNDLPRQMEWPMWVMQQAGMVFALPTGAIILWFVVRNWRPPVALMVGGIVFGWTAARIIKAYVDRGRPGALIDAVVAVTLAVVLSPYMPRWLRWSLYGLAAVVCFSRMYMGAHFPLDVIGGAAFGVVIGSSVNLMSGLRLDKVQPEALEFN